VAHFVNRLVFCMFAEDTGLLPQGYFYGMIDRCSGRNDRLFAGYRRLISALISRAGS
jgi:hypothetical protein